MKRLLMVGLLVCVACAPLAAAVDGVMGIWEGTFTAKDGAARPISAQVVADGGGQYHAIVKVSADKEIVLKGQIEGGKTLLRSEAGDSRGEIAGEAFTGECEGGRFSMKRVERKPPTLGAKPPQGAIVLFDGASMDEWIHGDDHAPEWKLVDGAMEVVSGWWPSKKDPTKKVHKNLYTKRKFKDFHMHLEFCCPFMPDKRDQGRGNSGVYLPDGSEIQVLDSFGKKPAWNECGGIYKQATPLVDAELPPGEWQTYDVDYSAPVYDEKRNLVKKTCITVRHNGLLIHDRFQVERKGRPEGPIMLQDHGNPVRYRNIWLVPKGD